MPDSAPEERGSAFSANSERSVLLSGSIKFSGAIPSAFKSNSSGRTAFPTAPTPLVYKIKATSGSSVIEFNSSEASSGGSITVAGDTITFTISLTSGTWALTASAEDSSGNKVLATKNAVSIPLTGDSPSVSIGDPLVLTYANSSSSGKGNIDLTISCDVATNIQSIKVNPLTGGISAATSNTTSDWLWSQSNVNPGSYKVEFLFYSGTDCSGSILYRINEVVNIYSNLTTDTFEDASYVSSGHIEITGSLLASAELVTIYVSSSGSDSGTGSYFSPVKTLKQAVNLVNNSSAAATTEFEILVRDNISLGGSATLNSGKKASITSENTSSVATVSGGSSHDSLTISGEAEVSNLNFSGLGGISVDGTGKLTLDGSISSNSKIYLSSKDNPLEIGTSFTTASPITVELNTDPSDSSHFAFGDLAIEATEAQVDYFTTPTDSGYSLVYKTAKNGAVLAISGDDAIIYVGGTDADDDTGTGTATAPFATLYKAVAVAKERYELIEGDYIIKVQDTITESQNIVVEDVPGLTIAGKVPEDSSDTKQVNGNGKSITFKCDTTLKNLEFKSFEASSTLAGPVTIYSGKEVEAEYVKVTNCTNTNGHGGGIYNAGTLTLTNCTVSGCKAIAASTSNGWGGGIYNSFGSSLSLEESTVEGNEAAHGGGIFIDTSCTAQITDSIIQSNTAKSTVSTGMGGGIFVNDGGSLTLSGSGSKVIQNTADSSTIAPTSTVDKNAYGGGIFCYGSMTMTDGTISENTLVAGSWGAEYGGGIALVAISTSSSSTFTMSGGTISKNSAKLGGGISTQGINLTLSGGTIGASTYDDGNTATQFGGGLYVGPYSSGLSTKKPDCTISVCTIKYNTANESGGGIFAEECTMSFSSGSVSNNKVYSDAATYISGGGVYIKAGNLNISGTAEISNNMVSTNSTTIGVVGGGLYIFTSGIVTMTGGSINANTVSTPAGPPTAISSGGAMGGGVYIFTNGKMELENGSINNNIASATSSTNGNAMGGGVYIFDSGELNMTGGTVNGNSASIVNGACSGGGMYSSGKLKLAGGEIRINSCDGSSSSTRMGGGIIVAPATELTWNGTTIESNTAAFGINYFINTGVIFTGQINGTGTTYSGTSISQQYD
ncbi:MAG: hypothetical protein J6X67_10055 [Treponema sp.]|nr:hypothetical protein [Treponema sp.]